MTQPNLEPQPTPTSEPTTTHTPEPTQIPEPTPTSEPAPTPEPTPEPSPFSFDKVDLTARTVTADTFKGLMAEDFDFNDNFLDEAEELTGMGLSPEQIVALHDRYGGQAEEPTPPTAQEVQAHLSSNLNTEQKRDYRAVGRMMSEHIPDVDTLNEFMSNPALVGIAHNLYKALVVGGRPVGEPAPSPIVKEQLTYEEALKSYQDYIKENTSGGKKIDWTKLQELKEDLASRCSNAERFLTIAG